MKQEQINELIRQSLKERWIPRTKARTWGAMDDVPSCVFCHTFFCGACPLKVDKNCCGGLWKEYTNAETLAEARDVSKEIVNFLESYLEKE